MTGGLIHARPMGSFVGEHKPKRDYRDRCPVCGGVKSRHAKTCVVCRPAKEVKRSPEAMDNHHRFEAAITAGWSEIGLIHSRPAIPTWEEIAERDPSAVLKWHPEVVIERWFKWD